MRAPYQTFLSKTLPRVLVLDANQRSALAVTRSLGATLLVTIFTADALPDSLAGASRHSSMYFQYPSPASAPHSFLQWLERIIREQEIDWVFPVTEISSQLILLESHVLGRARLPFATLAQVMSLADKWELVRTSTSANIPCPKTQHFINAAALIAQPVDFNYPLVLKPCQSRRWLGDHWLDTAVHVVNSSNELAELLAQKTYFRDHPFMLQEFIPGHGAGVFALYDKGTPVVFFAHQRLREKPPRGGVSVLSESVALDPKLEELAKKLLKAANWHGVAMVEFRITPQGKPYLMEVNTRFWGSLQLAIDAGVDFPALLLQICLGKPAIPPSTYTIGKRLRWLLGDVDSLYLFLRDPDFPLEKKLRRILDFLTPHPIITRHEINRITDLGPAWVELKNYIRSFRK